MAERTSIEWAANADGTAGATWNPIRAVDPKTGKVGTHCVHASDGCRFCYAESHNKRGMSPSGTGLPYTKQAEAKVVIYLDDRMLTDPLRRKKPTTYFVSSMSDIYADFVTDDMIAQIKAVQAFCPQHTFIELTKRADRARAFNSRVWPKANTVRVGHPIFHAIDAVGTRHLQGSVATTCAKGRMISPPANVWQVASCENQKAAEDRVFELLQTPAVIHGLSVEPLIGPIDLTRIKYCDGMTFNALDRENYPRLDWVIVGGESGQSARPMHPAWVRSLRDQCAKYGVPFFFKQWGAWAPVHAESVSRKCMAWSGDWWVKEKTDVAIANKWVAVERLGKGAAGRVLDGRTHDERPAILNQLKVAA